MENMNVETTIETITENLCSIIHDDERVIAGTKIPKEFLCGLGGLRADASSCVLVFALSTEEVSGVMRYAHQHKIAVTPRGVGTNLTGSTVPLYGGIILDLSRMDKIIELDADTFSLTCEAGALLKDVQAFVEERGFFYPPDPGEKASTIGGNISTNAGGMRAVKYGVTRDYVRSLEVVRADGTVLTLGGKTVKDSSGLSLKNLVIGSEGTLCVITKCVLRILPKPEFSVSALVPFESLKTGISCVIKILQKNVNPTAVEFIDRNVVALGEKFSGVKYPFPEARAYILLTFDGNKNEVENNVERARETILQNGAKDFLALDDKQLTSDIWKVRGSLVKAVEAVSEQEPIDIVVPINRSADFIEYVYELEKESGVEMVSFGHAGDGNVHLCVVRGKRDDDEWQKDLSHVLERLYKKSSELSGLVSGEHGIGVAKRKYFFQSMSSESIAMMREIKKALDPEGILNMGKSYCDFAPPCANR